MINEEIAPNSVQALKLACQSETVSDQEIEAMVPNVWIVNDTDIEEVFEILQTYRENVFKNGIFKYAG